MACSLAAFVVGLVFPTLESMKAIESHQTGDDKQVQCVRAAVARSAALGAALDAPLGRTRGRPSPTACPGCFPPAAQWLTYWVCYSTLLSLETVAWSLLIWCAGR
jgi:hypothetical protein